MYDAALGSVLAAAIAESWEEIDSAISVRSDYEFIENSILGLLRSLDGVDETDDGLLAQRAINDLLEYALLYPPIADVLERSLSTPRAPLRDIPLVEGSEQLVRYVQVPVMFASNRSDREKGKPSRANILNFNKAYISIPDDHRMGLLEKPSGWRLSFIASPERHVVVTTPAAMPKDLSENQFFAEMAGGRAALVFVHGYNVNHLDALRRSAQLAYDLNYDGVIVCFDWASVGSLQGYVADGDAVDWAAEHLCNLLKRLSEHMLSSSIDLIGHSMGARVLLRAIVGLREQPAAKYKNLIFAAPDVEVGYFNHGISTARYLATRLTIYVSSRDRALKISSQLNQTLRAGASPTHLKGSDNVDIVDATGIDTGWLGHSYFGDHKSVLSDIFYLIAAGLGPKERFGLYGITDGEARYWAFRP